MFDVLFTVAGLNVTEQLINVAAVKSTMLENPFGTATSLPIVPVNYDVVIAGVGLFMLLTHKVTVSTNVLELNAPVTVTVLEETEQLSAVVAPESICARHVTVVSVYSEGKVTVMVSDEVIASVS